MRFTRFSFIAGWAAVALLAAAGFATFGTSDGADPAAPASGATLGHTSGAYAGLAFAVLGVDPARLVEPGPDAQAATQQSEADPPPSEQLAPLGSTGTISSPEDGWLSQMQVRELVARYFAPEDVNRAVRVAWCESRFDPEAVNLRTGGVGLFQHLPKYWPDRAANAGFPDADPTDPEASTAAAAWEVYDGAGWDVFACRD